MSKPLLDVALVVVVGINADQIFPFQYRRHNPFQSNPMRSGCTFRIQRLLVVVAVVKIVECQERIVVEFVAFDHSAAAAAVASIAVAV